MTNLELTINLINGLNKAIKRDLELLELDRKSYLVAVESKNVRDMRLANESFLKHKTAMERRQTTLESYKASLQNVLDCTNMNMTTTNDDISEDDLNPSRFLCDKIWGDRHNR